MASRVRKIILVDGKTSGTMSSGLICHLNPMGGAAITGANGAGKTTSLQLIALFFGCIPANIVKQGNTRQGMLQFVLPNLTSAVAFEYQRGADVDDVRLVVIRRNPSTHAAEYRLFRGGFRQELFTKQDAHGLRLLDDSESVRAASELGVIVEGRKLSSADYRAIILRTRSQSKDADAISRISRDYSFARRSLMHMDRLVGAIVKEQINFRDFTEVAESMVQEAMGVRSESAGKIELKNMRAQVDQWIVNRNACEKADQLKDRIQKLAVDVDAHRAHHTKLRALRADVQALVNIIKALHAAAEIKLGDSIAGGAKRRGLEQERLKQLMEDQHKLQQALSDLQLFLECESKRVADFESNEVAMWAERLQQVNDLIAQTQSLDSQIKLNRSDAENIERDFNDEMARQNQATLQSLERLESGKKRPNEACQTAEDERLINERDDRTQLLAKNAEEFSVLNAALQEFYELSANAKAQIGAPAAPPELAQRLQEAKSLLEQIKHQLSQDRDKRDLCLSQQHKAEREAIQIESDLRMARHREGKARSGLDDAKRAQQPKPGSVLAALRASTLPWQSNIARIINAELIDRTDVTLIQTERSENDLDSSVDCLFGWKVDLSNVATPSWADSHSLALDIEAKAAVLQAAQDDLARLLKQAEATEKLRRSAKEELEKTEASWSVSSQNYTRRDIALKDQTRIIETWQAQAVNKFKAEYAAVQVQLLSMRREESSLRACHASHFLLLDQKHKALRQAIMDQRWTELESIDRQKKDVVLDAEKRTTSMTEDRNKKMIEKGVDLERLASLENDKKRIQHRLHEIESHRAFVEVWAAWVAGGGPAVFSDKQEDNTRISKSLASAKSAISRHEQAMQTARAEQSAGQSRLELALQGQKSEINALYLLDARLNAFEPEQTSAVTEDSHAKELEGRAQTSLARYEQDERNIFSVASSLENQLTSGNDEVSALVCSYLSENLSLQNTSANTKARHLVDAYNKIPEQVTAQINRELAGILSTFASVRSQVRRYELEVKSFNRKLQQGIAGIISGFGRLQDFEVNVVTTFEEIGFLKKLDDLHVVITESRSMNHLGINKTIASRSTAEHLQSICGALGKDSFEVDLKKYMTLSGRATDDGNVKEFHSEEGLKNISSTGITAIAMITLLAGMLNVVRGTDEIYIPWSSDEIGRFDAANFRQLMGMLKENRIDVITASPDLKASAYSLFEQRYLFKAGSDWMVYVGDNKSLEDINQGLSPKTIRDAQTLAFKDLTGATDPSEPSEPSESFELFDGPTASQSHLSTDR